MTPLLTVCIITYNHAGYIKQALNGVLAQKTNFPFSILVADDFSTDGTRDILLSYKEKYPESISLILQEKNVGPAQNWVDLITAPQSKYIAYLEGDDYWIDNNKLQKQVDFLERNADHSFCFHQALRIHEQSSAYDVYPQNKLRSFDARAFFKMITIPMGSIVYRKEVPIQVIKNHSHGDFLMLCSLLSYGKAYFFPEVMSVYRVHANGVSFKHGSLPYVTRRINELYIEGKLPALSDSVRNQIGRVYMEHTLNMFENYKREIPKTDVVRYAYRFLKMKGEGIKTFLPALLRYLFQ